MKRASMLILLPVFTVLTFSGCSRHAGYVIKGELTGIPDSTIFYLENSATQELFDSVAIQKNRFVFKGVLQDTPEELYLTSKVGNQFIFTYLIIGNENVTISGDIKDFPRNLKITGSKSQDDYNYLQGLTKTFDGQRDSMVRAFFSLSPDLQKEKGKEVWSRIDVIDDTTRSIKTRYIKSHINTYAGIMTLGYLKNSMPKDTVRAIYDKLSPEIKASKYARIIEVYLREKISEIGDKYHDFEAYNKRGEMKKLSDLMGKYILLDFTSANCGPCVQSVKELRSINKTYGDSVTIVGFSGDSKKETWLKSLDRDTITWTSLWDGQGTYSETYIKYGVQGFPSFFLIDPNGKIIDKWVGYGDGSLLSRMERFDKK